MPLCTTYKLVGDNIDKNIRPREMRSDYQTRSLHFFHSYALLDRVDMSGFSEKMPEVDMSHIDLKNLLPSSVDAEVIQKNFAVLVSRTLAKYMPFFKTFCRGMERHIPHEFAHETAQKSEVVSCVYTMCSRSLLHNWYMYIYMIVKGTCTCIYFQ